MTNKLEVDVEDFSISSDGFGLNMMRAFYKTRDIPIDKIKSIKLIIELDDT
jgi:hypothetical protein